MGPGGGFEDPGRVHETGVDLSLSDPADPQLLQPGPGPGAAPARVDHEIGGQQPALLAGGVDADAGDPGGRTLQGPYAALLERGDAAQAGHPGADHRVEEVATARDVELLLPAARDPPLGGLGDQVGGQAAADGARRRPVVGDAREYLLDGTGPARPHDVDVPGLRESPPRRRAVGQRVGVDDRDRRVLGEHGRGEQAGHAPADDDGVAGRGGLGHRGALCQGRAEAAAQ